MSGKDIGASGKDIIGFPKSDTFVQTKVGLYLSVGGNNEAYQDFHDLKRKGAEEEGCVNCMLYFGYGLAHQNRFFYLAYPWLLKGAIRGHVGCICSMLSDCYTQMIDSTKVTTTDALVDYWSKTIVPWIDESNKATMRKLSETYIGKI
jgi:hypothetical protein